MRALERAISEAIQRPTPRPRVRLALPPTPRALFAFLSTRARQQDGESVVLFDHNRPLAWAGEIRIDPDTLTAPISVTFSPFYTTLNVVKTKGDRRAVASAVLQPRRRPTGSPNP